LDILVNNAGVLSHVPPHKTLDAFEIHWGTNHLSHFALTLQLLPSLKRSSAPRVVNVSSGMAKEGKIDFDDLNLEKLGDNKRHWPAYSQSKLANLLFTLGLKRKSEECGWNLLAVSAHPGFSITGMTNNLTIDFWGVISFYILKPFLSQSAEDGALPQTFAATSSEVKSGGYYGPKGILEVKGKQVGDASMPPLAKNEELAERLWKVSEELTGTTWELP